MTEGSPSVAKKVLVIGLDGATPDLLFPWAQEGHLPNLAKLMSQGAWGPMESTTPPFTAMAWPAFFTGCNPGKTGIFSFFDDIRAANRRPVTAKSLRAKPIWEILNEHGRRSVVVAVPITYPPAKFNGVMISGMDAPDEKSPFTFPPELRDEIMEQGYKIFPDRYLGYEGHTDELYAEALEVATLKTKVFTDLLRDEEWDFGMIVLNEVDILAHFIPTQRLFDFYRETDELVGRMMEAAGPETVIVIISDHGLKTIKGRLFVNEILKDLGLLRLKQPTTTARVLGGLGLTRERMRSVAKRLGLAEGLRRHAPGALDAGRKAFSPGLSENADIDMTATKLYFDCGYWLRVVDGAELTPKEIADVEQALGRYGVKMLPGRDLYHGPYAKHAPDYVVYTPEYLNAQAMGTGKWTGEPTARVAEHTMEATGILSGSDHLISRGPIRGSLLDWVPTLLYLMGLTIPAEVDGEVLTQGVSPETLHARPPRRDTPDSGRQKLQERIRALKGQGTV